MRALSPRDILGLWEAGQEQDPVSRALTLLRAACPEISSEESLALTVGERDARLFRLRELMFGPILEGYADCVRCGRGAVFELDARGVCAGHSAPAAEYALEAGEYSLRFRLPTSADLLPVLGSPEVTAAQAALAGRCVTEARRGAQGLDPGDLPAEIVDRLAHRMAEAQPEAEILLDLACPACGERWQALLDIASFLWTEIASRAKRLLRDVHTLASAYGWREAEILALSDVRRDHYLQMAAR